MKRGALESMKFMVLQNTLRKPRYVVIGVLEGLWYFASSNAMDGAIGRFSDIEIAGWLGWEGDAGELIAALVLAKWVDKCAENRLVIHDWHEHCPTYIRGNMNKHGRQFAVAKQPAISTVHSNVAEQPAMDASTNSIPSTSIPSTSSQCLPQPSAAPPSQDEGADSAPRCPYTKIVALYHEVLPAHPRVKEVTDSRRAHMRARWVNGMEQNLETFRSYFEAVKRSKFLTGRVDPGRGRSKPFVADFDFLMKESTYVKILEGKYRD